MAESDLVAMPDMNIPANKILLMPDRRWMLISGEDSKLGVVDMNAEGGPKVTQLIDATPGNITSFELLLGGNSLLISDDKGETSQWFLVRNENNEWLLTKIRASTAASTGFWYFYRTPP